MKKGNTNKYIFLLVTFLVMLGLSLLFFMNRYENINIKNIVNDLLLELYSLDSGKYSVKNGEIYSGEYKTGLKSVLDTSGDIQIDKYNNVRFRLKHNNKCIYKNYEGNVKVKNGICSPYRKINVSINKNNNKVSFISDRKGLLYKISSNDDYIGSWVKEDYSDNIVIKAYNEGTNYIWFKDSDGNLSEVLSFNVDCLYTSKTNYDKNVFYCSGSTVRLDNMYFVVVKDSNETIKLMKFTPIEDKLSMCGKVDSKYCFYSKNKKNTYNYDNSYVNYYLNNVFVNELSNETISNIVDSEICTDLNSKCNGELCVGYTKEEIVNNHYLCRKYTQTKIRLINYNEFNYVYSKANNKNVLNGYYLAINSFYKDKGSSVQYDNSFYIYEDFNKVLDIKPLFTLHK